jgi:hypothetical protein
MSLLNSVVHSVSAGNWFCLQSIFPKSIELQALIVKLQTCNPLLLASSLSSLPPSSLPLPCSLKLLGGWEGLAEAGHPCLDTPHWGSRGLFPLMTRQKLEKIYLNPIRSDLHPLKYLFISGGVSWPHPPKTIFLRRDILSLRYMVRTQNF